MVLPKVAAYDDDGGHIRTRKCDDCGMEYKTTERADLTVERRAAR